MKIYALYMHPASRSTEAVKLGWSWPGFLFTPFWPLFKKLWVFAVVAWIAVIVSSFFPAEGGGAIFAGVISMATNIWAGIRGNQMRQANLESRGYQLTASNLVAKNPEDALAKGATASALVPS
jgi:hypothetical protein